MNERGIGDKVGLKARVMSWSPCWILFKGCRKSLMHFKKDGILLNFKKRMSLAAVWKADYKGKCRKREKH